MRHSLAIAAFAFAALAAPASAQSDAADALEAIDNPEAVEVVAERLEMVTKALLDLPVGPLLQALGTVDPGIAEDVDPDATLGEVTRSDPDLPERLGEEARVNGLVAGQTARDLAVALPVLRAMASDLAAQWRNRIADARRDRR